MIDLFRTCPALGLRVLQAATDIALPARARPRVSDAQFSDLAPPEYHADLVIRVEGSRGRLHHVLVIEVQLGADGRKRYTWPLYVVGERARLRCPVTLMVVTLTERMARWCSRRIPLDLVGNGFQPLVVGPTAIPRITDMDQARAFPELAVLSAASHGHERDGDRIAMSALAGCSTLDKDRGALYADFVLAHLGQEARRILEAFMRIEGYEYQSDFARKYVAEGRREGLETMLVRQIEQRFGALPPAIADAIHAADASQLLSWGERVLTAASLADLFGSAS